MKIVVLGGGIIGVTTAYFLGIKGHQVTVIDAETSVANKTSFANGSQLSYSYTDALGSPSMIPKLPQLILGQDPAFTIHPSFDPQLLGWGTRFLRNCTAKRELDNSQAVFHLAMHSRQVLHQLLDERVIDFDHRIAGKLRVFSHQNDLRQAILQSKWKQELGCPIECLDATETLNQEPALKQIAADVAGSIYSPLDEVGDAYRFATSLAEICHQEYGCKFLLGHRVEHIHRVGHRIQHILTDKGKIEADAYVFALGAHSPLLAKTIGVKIPIYPIKGYSITVPALSGAPQISVTDSAHKMVYCTLGDKLRIAGIAELIGYDETVRHQKIEQLLNLAKTRFPKAGDYNHLLHQWSGLRPSTPQSSPLLGRSKLDNLFLNTGHGMLGWTLACGSAEIVANMIDGGSEMPMNLQKRMTSLER